MSKSNVRYAAGILHQALARYSTLEYKEMDWQEKMNNITFDLNNVEFALRNKLKKWQVAFNKIQEEARAAVKHYEQMYYKIYDLKKNSPSWVETIKEFEEKAIQDENLPSKIEAQLKDLYDKMGGYER